MKLQERLNVLLKTINQCSKKNEFTKARNYSFKYVDLCETHGDGLNLQKIIPSITKILNVDIEINVEVRLAFYQLLGKIYFLLNEYHKALNILNKSLDILSEQDDNERSAFSKNGIAAIYCKIGRFQEAIELCNEAFKDIEDNNTEISLNIKSSIYNNLGASYFKLGQYRLALESFEKSHDHRKHEQDETKAQLLFNIGRCFIELNDTDRAFSYFNDANNIYNNLDNVEGRAKIQNAYGMIFFNRGEIDEALKHYKKALYLFQKCGDKKGVSSTQKNISDIYIRVGDFDNAIALLNDSLEYFKKIKDHSSELNTISSLGHVYLKMGDTKKAREIFTHLKDLTFRSRERFIYVKSIKAIGISYYKEGNFEFSKESLVEAFDSLLEIIATSPGSSIRIRLRKLLDSIVEYLCLTVVQLEEYNLALEFLEQVKSQELLYHLQQKEDKLSKRSKTLLDQIHKTKIQIEKFIDKKKKFENTLNHSDKEKKAHLQKITRKIRKHYKRQRDLELKSWLTSERMPVGSLDFKVIWKSLFHRLRNESAAFLYFFYSGNEEKFILFFHEFSQPIEEMKVFITKLPRSSYNELIDDKNEYFNLVNDEFQFFGSGEEKLKILSKKMQQYLIPDDLLKELYTKKIKYLFLLPKATLNHLPFEILYDGMNYWGEQYIITRTYSLTLLSLLLSSSISSSLSRFFIVSPKTKELIQAKNEVEEISELLKINEIKYFHLNENEVTSQNFTQIINNNDFSVIHYAGHSKFNLRDPSLSYLLLNSESKSKAMFYATDITNKLSLSNSPLVVLSSCESGMSYVTYGDEQFGLTQSFILAGASSVLATAWRILDDSSKDFMVHFYKKLMTGFNIGEAILHSRKQIIEAEEDGKYEYNLGLIRWGAFQFIGNPFQKFIS